MDEGLLRRARSGDREALSALCEALYPPLRRFFARLCRSAQGADDLTQAALLRMLERLPDYRPLPGARFEGWVFRIAYRLFLDGKQRAPALPLPDCEIADPAGGPEQQALCGERAAAVRRAVGTLPDELRAMVAMRYELDMGYRDIAAALRIDPVRVKWRLHDALKQLEILLREVGPWTNNS